MAGENRNAWDNERRLVTSLCVLEYALVRPRSLRMKGKLKSTPGYAQTGGPGGCGGGSKSRMYRSGCFEPFTTLLMTSLACCLGYCPRSLA